MRKTTQSIVAAWMFGGVALLSSAASGHATDGEPEAELRNKQIISEAFAGWAAGGTSFFDDVLHDQAVWTIEGSSPSAGTFQGRQQFMEKAVRPFATRLQSPVRPHSVTLWADGEHVIAHWRGSAVAKDGRDYKNSYAWIFKMRDGKAEEVTAFLDLAPYDDVLRRIPAQQ